MPIIETKSIPEIRKRLFELAEEHNLPELRELAEASRRRPALRNASIKRNKLTPELAENIRRYAAANPSLNLDEIGRVFNVAGGRVSEAIHNDK